MKNLFLSFIIMTLFGSLAFPQPSSITLHNVLVPGTSDLTTTQVINEFNRQDNLYGEPAAVGYNAIHTQYPAFTWTDRGLGITMLAWPMEIGQITNIQPRFTADAVVGYLTAARNDPAHQALYQSRGLGGAEFLLAVQAMNNGTPEVGGFVDQVGGTRIELLTTARAVLALWQCASVSTDPIYRNAAISGANWIYNTHPAYPYSFPATNYWDCYSNANMIGAQITAMAVTYEFTGDQRYLDRAIQTAEELMAWQDFMDSRDPWGETRNPDGTWDGGWYYYDYSPQPSPPPGTPTNPGPHFGWCFSKPMRYHTTSLEGLIDLLEAVGHQSLPGTTTLRNGTNFLTFKINLINSIMRGLNFMIDNQESTTLGVRGDFQEYKEHRDYAEGSLTPTTTYASAVTGLRTIVRAYTSLYSFSSVADADLARLLQLIRGYAQNVVNHDIPGWQSAPRFLQGMFKGWSAYLDFVSHPSTSRNLALINPSFEDPLIGWELWSWDGGGVSVVNNLAHTGTHSVRITDNSLNASKWAALLVTAQPNMRYTAGAYVYVVSGDHQTIEIEYLGDNYQHLSDYESYRYPNAGFQQISVSAVAPAGTKYLRLILYADWYHASDGYWDDVTVTQSLPKNGTADYNENAAVIENKTDKMITLDVYPTPANPYATIQYKITSPGRVVIDIFDVYGRHIANLVNSYRDVGEYSLNFGGTNLASGIYFCRIQNNGSALSKRILFLK